MSMSEDDLNLMADGTVIVADDETAYQKQGNKWWPAGDQNGIDADQLLSIDPLLVVYNPGDYQ